MRSLLSALMAHVVTPLLSIGVLLVLFVIGCGKDKEGKTTPDIMTSVETSAVTFTSPVSAEFSGVIGNEGKKQILDYGFVYGFTEDIDVAKGTKLSLSANFTSGSFTTTISNLQFPNVNGGVATLFVKAYLTDNSGTHYGKAVSNTYKGTLTSDVQPLSGKVGDVITIKGGFKGLKSSDIKVTFANTPAELISLTESALTVEVPKGIPVGHGTAVSIKVQAAAANATATTGFSIWANITNMIPRSGPIGTKITFEGDNLPLTKDAMTMTLGNSTAIRYYEDAYFVRVPSSLSQEKVKLYQYRNNDRVELPFEFTVIPPVIKSITPNPAFDQQQMTIHLDNVSPEVVGDLPLLTIGSFTKSMLPNQSGDLVFKLTGNQTGGKTYPVTFSYGPHTVTSAEPLTIARQEATGFSPTTGFPAMPLRITGKFIVGTTSYISFYGSYFIPVVAHSTTELLTYVPESATGGTFTVQYRDDQGRITDLPGSYVAKPFKFDAVTPASGPAGTTFTISGGDFYDGAGTGFHTIIDHSSLRSSEVGLNKIVMKLSTITTPGTYPIRLTYEGAAYNTGLFFTVTP